MRKITINGHTFIMTRCCVCPMYHYDDEQGWTSCQLPSPPFPIGNATNGDDEKTDFDVCPLPEATEVEMQKAVVLIDYGTFGLYEITDSYTH